jgi:hypothetical protein
LGEKSDEVQKYGIGAAWMVPIWVIYAVSARGQVLKVEGVNGTFNILEN